MAKFIPGQSGNPAGRDKLVSDHDGELLERVEFDPETRSCDVHYRVGVRDKVASPTGFEPVSPP